MFHSNSGLFFNREADGSVTITKTRSGKLPSETTPDDIVFQQTLDDGTWCSAVCTVSVAGEEHLRWYKAMDFHNKPHE